MDYYLRIALVGIICFALGFVWGRAIALDEAEKMCRNLTAEFNAHLRALNKLQGKDD